MNYTIIRSRRDEVVLIAMVGYIMVLIAVNSIGKKSLNTAPSINDISFI